MEEELGLHPGRSDVQGRGEPGWDGEYGPFFERNFQFVNHAHIEQSDYVSHALAGELSLVRLARIDALQMVSRMTAIRDSIAVLPERPRRVSATSLVLVTAESVVEWAARSDRGDPRLQGDGFLFVFALLVQKGKPAKERGRWLRKSRSAISVRFRVQQFAGNVRRLESPFRSRLGRLMEAAGRDDV